MTKRELTLTLSEAEVKSLMRALIFARVSVKGDCASLIRKKYRELYHKLDNELKQS